MNIYMNFDSAMLGEMGIQEICLGKEVVYKREGSYCYIELGSEDDE